jgi:hypothetical protein
MDAALRHQPLLPGIPHEIDPEMVAGGWVMVWVEPSQPLSPGLQPSVLLDPEIEQNHVPEQLAGQPHVEAVK